MRKRRFPKGDRKALWSLRRAKPLLQHKPVSFTQPAPPPTHPYLTNLHLPGVGSPFPARKRTKRRRGWPIFRRGGGHPRTPRVPGCSAAGAWQGPSVTGLRRNRSSVLRSLGDVKWLGGQFVGLGGVSLGVELNWNGYCAVIVLLLCCCCAVMLLAADC